MLGSLEEVPRLLVGEFEDGLPISVLFAVPIAVIGRPKLAGMGCPAISFNLGLGSNRSMWLGAPSMNRKITRLALGS